MIASSTPHSNAGEVLTGHPAQPFIEIGCDNPCPVLLAAAHSGRAYPQELIDQSRLPLDQLRRLEDPLVDHLIEEAGHKGIGTITATYARAWIDLNRRETEVDPRQIRPRPAAHVDHRSPRVTAGLGLIPQSIGPGRLIYSEPLGEDMLAARILRVHRVYHDRIAERLAQIREKHGIALLCDIHSMPSLPASQAADIVLGDRHGRSAAPWIVDLITEWLMRRGLKVTRNAPYAGGYGTERHGNPANAIHAIQIEIDRRLYLDGTGLAFNGNAPAMQALICELGEMLRGYLESRPGYPLAAE